MHLIKCCLRIASTAVCLWAAGAYATSSASDLVEAKAQYEAGRFQAAITRFGQAIARQPGNSEALRGRGLAYMRIYDFDEALKDFQAASDELGPYREKKFPGVGGYLDWERARQEYSKGNQALERGSFDEAIASYKKALSIYPHYPQCLHNIAIALGKKKDYQGAAVACMEAISIRHSDWKFWRTLSLSFFRQSKYRLALDAMQRSLRLSPPAPDAAEIIDDIEIIKERM